MLDPKRRSFLALVSGVAAAVAATRSKAGATPQVESFMLPPSGPMPNNPRLPVLLFRQVLPAGDDPPAACEALFRGNGWPPQWRAGVFGFHHYHSTAHEALGFVRGGTRLMLGGPGGHVIDVRAGDVAVLPTGTGHCNMTPGSDLLVVGAYPPDQTWDICRASPDPAAVRRMAALPFPARDPVEGAAGPLTRLWPSD
ncbi:MAG: cupin [Caulobacteraceae bacterium]|nr:cupin [Caulobacter sp.]